MKNKILMMAVSAFLVASPMSSGATMPELTNPPSNEAIAKAAISTCLGWAKNQSQDATDMWGIMIDGRSSRALAILRLATYCLDDDVPDIVGAQSSAGAIERFCQDKSSDTIKICARQ